MSHAFEVHNPRPGQLRILGPFDVPGLEARRRVRVYLPRDYGRDSHRALYMFDGQNVFDDRPSYAGGWHLHETADRIATRARKAPVVIAIDHGGPRRIDELSPFAGPRSAGQADRLLEWVMQTVMPALGPQLRLERGPVGAAVGGSSMGGLAALYAHFRYPGAFGGAVAMSPSLWFAGGKIFEFIADAHVPAVSRVYIDCGAKEGRGSMLAAAERMARVLSDRGYGDDRLMWRPDPRGTHSEGHWRRRAPKALRFMYG